VDGGTTVTPNVTADVDGVRVTVERLIAAPSVIRVDVRIDSDEGPIGWSPIGEVRHMGRTVPFVTSSNQGLPGSVSLMTGTGVGDPSGRWTISFRSVDSQDPGDPPRGPSVMEFDIP
jgi:hypothetical protein